MRLARRQSHRRALVSLLLVCVIFTTACSAAKRAASVRALGGATPTSTAVPTGTWYLDAKLGFRLEVPAGWRVEPEPGARAPSHNSALTLYGPEQQSHQLIEIGVIEGPGMPAAFAARGAPTARIGAYPAFVADRTVGEARVLCVARIFLARSDYVIANWCAMDAPAHAAQLSQILATFQPAPPVYQEQPEVAPPPATCAEAQAALGYAPASVTTWGKTQGAPTDTKPAAGWGALAPGVYVCSNERSADQYLFQCTELVNRYLYELWALPHLPGNAARYFDYYEDGSRFPGVARDLPAGAYQLSDDASQGASAFRPAPGDLLIFQDVNDPAAGWTSGLTSSPGHVAIITAVDATHVYIAQENYNETQYFLALPLQSLADGYHIVDRSGLSNRITRGWIRFTLPA